MKKYSKMIVAMFALSIISNSIYSQKKSYVPEKGFWVLVSNVHNQKITTVQFYTNDRNLIYEEKVTGVKFKLNRRKTLLYLKEGLGKAITAWNEKREILRDKNWVSILVKK